MQSHHRLAARVSLGLALLASAALPQRALAAPYLVKDIALDEESAFGMGDGPDWATAYGNLLLFTCDDRSHGVELWRSDGTAEGTFLLRDIAPGTDPSNPGGPERPHRYAPVLDGSLLFHANAGGANGGGIWKTDGSGAGTALVSNAAAGFGYGVRFGSQVLFAGTSGGDENLWKTNGGDTQLVKSFYLIQGIVELRSGLALLTASDGTGLRLYRSDGESAGTTQLNSTPNASLWSGQAAILNGALLYVANGLLWRSDGTSEGTQQLSSVIVGQPEEGEPFVQANGLVYFYGNGQALWKSDGTPAGTVQLKLNRPEEMAAVGDTLYFVIEPLSDAELWKTDGTSEGTLRVKGGFDRVRHLTPVRGELYFAADDGVHGEELWKSDGTEAGTQLVADLAPGDDSLPSLLTLAGDTLFFAAADGTSGRELWALALPPLPDAGQPDAAAPDAGDDAGTPDAGELDAGVNPDADAPELDAAVDAAAPDSWDGETGADADQLDAGLGEADAEPQEPEEDTGEPATDPQEEEDAGAGAARDAGANGARKSDGCSVAHGSSSRLPAWFAGWLLLAWIGRRRRTRPG